VPLGRQAMGSPEQFPASQQRVWGYRLLMHRSGRMLKIWVKIEGRVEMENIGITYLPRC
jgi:hypothetical protein